MQLQENVLSAEQIQKLNAFVDQHYSYDKFIFVFPNLNPEFKKFFIETASEKIKKFINDESYIVLRIVNSDSDNQEHQFHFDTYAETVLVPLLDSQAANNGDLLISQNTRQMPSSAFGNAFSKVLYQNIFSRKYFLNKAAHFFKRIQVKPGALFCFNGAVCLHGNMPIDSGCRRTVLIHNKKLFKNSIITKMVEKFSQYNVSKNNG